MPRYDKHTETEVQEIFFRDFDSSFKLNPVTGNLATVQNAEDVKKLIRNLILTGRGERFYQPQLGTKLATLLFENADSVTIELVRTTISQAISQNLPMVELLDLTVQDPGVSTRRGAATTPNEVRVSITFAVHNLGITETVTVPIRRVR